MRSITNIYSLAATELSSSTFNYLSIVVVVSHMWPKAGSFQETHFSNFADYDIWTSNRETDL